RGQQGGDVQGHIHRGGTGGAARGGHQYRAVEGAGSADVVLVDGDVHRAGRGAGGGRDHQPIAGAGCRGGEGDPTAGNGERIGRRRRDGQRHGNVDREAAAGCDQNVAGVRVGRQYARIDADRQSSRRGV